MKSRRILLTVAGAAVVAVVVAAGGLLGWRFYAGVREVAPSDDSLRDAFPACQVPAEDWPWWRGPTGDGNTIETAPLLKWSATSNVLWKIPVPGSGHASPSVWGDQLFVLTADEEAQAQSLIGYDRRSGRQRWLTVLHRGGFMVKHTKNSQATATPACDGRHVYTLCARAGAVWATATDLAGHIVWQTEVGPFISEWGYSSSPAIYDKLLIVNAESRGSKLERIRETSFLAALNRKTGQLVWRVRRPDEYSYGSPIVATLGGRTQVVVSGAFLVASYDPASGRELWRCRWSAGRATSTVAVGDGCVYATASHPRKELLCIRADGSGDVTDTHVVWRSRKEGADVPSPLWREDCLYHVDDHAVAACLDGKTGKELWRKHLGDEPVSASPLLIGGYLYVSNESGTTYVLRLGNTVEQVAQNVLDDPLYATPVISRAQLFLRTHHFLWCIGALDKSTAQSGSGSP